MKYCTESILIYTYYLLIEREINFWDKEIFDDERRIIFLYVKFHLFKKKHSTILKICLYIYIKIILFDW